MERERFQHLDILLVCGLPGSGKSRFARSYFMQSGRKRANFKEIRRLLCEMTSFGQKWSEKEFAASDEFLVKHVERKIIEHLLQNRQKLLVDNTSMSRESRKAYLTIAHQTGKSIGAGRAHIKIRREAARTGFHTKSGVCPIQHVPRKPFIEEFTLEEEGDHAVTEVPTETREIEGGSNSPATSRLRASTSEHMHCFHPSAPLAEGQHVDRGIRRIRDCKQCPKGAPE